GGVAIGIGARGYGGGGPDGDVAPLAVADVLRLAQGVEEAAHGRACERSCVSMRSVGTGSRGGTGRGHQVTAAAPRATTSSAITPRRTRGLRTTAPGRAEMRATASATWRSN